MWWYMYFKEYSQFQTNVSKEDLSNDKNYIDYYTVISTGLVGKLSVMSSEKLWSSCFHVR